MVHGSSFFARKSEGDWPEQRSDAKRMKRFNLNVLASRLTQAFQRSQTRSPARRKNGKERNFPQLNGIVP